MDCRTASVHVQEGMEVLEHVVIDGDTETGATTNINDIGGTPAGTEAFMLFNGFRKSGLSPPRRTAVTVAYWPLRIIWRRSS